MVYNSFLDIDGGFSLTQYGALLCNVRFFRAFWNSVGYTFVILVFSLPISLTAAYGFSRFDFKGKIGMLFLVILTMLLPFQATMVSQYMVLKWLGLINTPAAVIMPNIFGGFSTFLLTQYMSGIDRAIYEAADIEGIGALQTFLRIIIPQCKNMICGVAILSLVNYWSMIEQPSMFLNEYYRQPLSIQLGGTAFKSFANAGGVIFCILPLMLLYYNSDELIEGIGWVGGQGSILKKRDKKGLKPFVVFFVFMLAATLMAQKLSYLTTPKVSVYNPNTPVNVLSEYQTVIPEACLKNGAVYFIDIDRYNNTSYQAVAVPVTPIVFKDGYVALEETLSNDRQIIFHSSLPLHDGDVVEVLEDAAK